MKSSLQTRLQGTKEARGMMSSSRQAQINAQKIELKADEAGITPKEFVDNVAGDIRRIWDLMDTSYDKFIRTTDEEHEKQVQKIFKKLYDQGDIYKGHYEGMYCTAKSSPSSQSLSLSMGNALTAGVRFSLRRRRRISLK